MRVCHPAPVERNAADWATRQKQLYQHQWMVYAQAPLGGPTQVLEYLSRYTHRTAIGNERIREVSEREVAFTVRADDKGGKRLLRQDGVEFVRLFLLHVLPSGIKHIRHYGLLASGCKAKQLSAARLALQMPALNAQALESAQGFMARVAKMDLRLCPICKVGRLRTAVVLVGVKLLPAPGTTGLPPSTGPP